MLGNQSGFVSLGLRPAREAPLKPQDNSFSVSSNTLENLPNNCAFFRCEVGGAG